MEACWLLVLWPGKCTRQRTVGGWGFADMVSHTETHRHGAWAWPPGLGGLSARLDTQLGLEAQRTQKRRSPRRRRPESGGGGCPPRGWLRPGSAHSRVDAGSDGSGQADPPWAGDWGTLGCPECWQADPSNSAVLGIAWRPGGQRW